MSSAGTSSEAAAPAEAAGRRRVEGIVALVAVQLCFGLFPLFVKLAHDEGEGFGPRAIAFWRILFGALLLGAVAWRVHGRAAVPRRADLGRLAVCALLGIALNQVFAMEGMTRTSVLNAGLLMTLIPVFTYALALAARQESFRAPRAAGIALALAGAALLTLWTRGAGGSGSLLGNLLIMVNCLSYAGFLVVARPLLRRYPPLVVTTWVFVLALWCLPIVVAGQDLVPAAPTARAWVGIGYTLVFATLVAYVLNTWALERVSASTTAAFINIQPLIAGAAGVTFLGEPLTVAELAAAALLLAGITLVVRSPARRA